jgi:hypothetical protein
MQSSSCPAKDEAYHTQETTNQTNIKRAPMVNGIEEHSLVVTMRPKLARFIEEGTYRRYADIATLSFIRWIAMLMHGTEDSLATDDSTGETVLSKGLTECHR